MRLIISWFINTIALLLVSKMIPGIFIQDFSAALFGALILAAFNAFLKPILLIITLPINVVMLGLFTFFINAFLFYLASKVVSGFTIAGFWSAFFGAILFGVINFLLNLIMNPVNKINVRFYSSGARTEKPKGRVIDAEIVEEKKEQKQLH